MGRRKSITAGAISLGLAGAAVCAPDQASAAVLLELESAAQQPQTTAVPGDGSPSPLAGLAESAPAQAGVIDLAAVRAWVWDEGAVRRVLLDKDARITLGGSTYTARQAALWIEELPPTGGERRWKVAAHFADLGGTTSNQPGQTISQSGERVLVVSVVQGPAPKLRADIMTRERPAASEAGAFVAESDERIARAQATELTPPAEMAAPAPAPPPPPLAPAADAPTTDAATISAPPTDAPTPDAQTTSDLADPRGPMPPAERVPVVMPEEGVINLFWENLEVVAGERADESALVLSGGAVVQAQSWAEDGRSRPTLQLMAERAVVFLRGGAESGLSRYRMENVSGVYLEGDVVATDGKYTLRGARIFVEVPSLRAVVLDAVFWTYDARRGMPLYLRAEAIRQESLSQWRADKATLANVAFAEPSFAVGATSVTLTRVPTSTLSQGGTGGTGGGGPGAGGSGSGPGGEGGLGGGIGQGGDRFTLDARNPTFTAGGVPLAWAPSLRGEFRPAPIKRLQYESFAGDNAVRATLDMNNILGIDAPPGNDFDLGIDGFFERGVGLAPELTWDRTNMTGQLEGYWIYDDGTDQLGSGAEIDRDGEHRGMALGENIWRLTDSWTLFAEGAYISDPAFIDAYFPREGETRREFTNSVYARRLTEQDILTIEGRANLNDFIANEYLLQSLGYNTQKLPELTYTRFEPELLGGLVSYAGEARYSRMSLNFSEPALREYGFNNNRRAGTGFGLTPNQSLAEVFQAQGLDENTVNRFDTRHDLEAPLAAGPVNINPFVVGRFTAWDTAFDDFNNADNDAYRMWGAGGVRVGTSMQHVDDSVRSEFFDLSRIRHIVEPSVTAWHAGTTIDQTDLPIYDDDVESLGEGTTVRAGARQTWQTYRGGEGRLRSTDWLVWNTDYVWASSEAEIESPFGRFIEARPEHGNAGRFLTTDAVMQMTDALALTGSWLYDTDEGQTARTTGGVILDHGFGFSTYAGVRDLDPLSSTLIDLGARYEFTRKHALGVFVVYDLSNDDYQTLGARLTRRFPQWTVDLSVSSDRISDDVSASVTLRPVGMGGETRRRVFTQEGDAADVLREQPRTVRESRLDYGPFRDP